MENPTPKLEAREGCPWFWDMLSVPVVKWGELVLPSLGR